MEMDRRTQGEGRMKDCLIELVCAREHEIESERGREGEKGDMSDETHSPIQ